MSASIADERFAARPGWPWVPRYTQHGRWRVAWVDEGPPAGAPVALCLHGNPAWGYLYRHMIPEFLQAGLEFEYVPVDICAQAIRELTAGLAQDLPAGQLRVQPIVAEYFDSLALVRRQSACRNVVLFLGSNIGNFGPAATRRFLRRLAGSLNPGDYVLIGFDLKKDPETLRRAYDDREGLTRAFNLNLLERINRELGGGFDRDRFAHHAAYHLRRGCMESWLVSLEPQRVPIRRLNRTFSFAAWEGIFLECSYKYELPQIESLAAEHGFVVRQHLLDRAGRFADSLWQVTSRRTV